MKQSSALYSILLFIVALCCFLLSEVYFFLNPIFSIFSFADLYLFPLIIYLLSLGATAGLSLISRPIARRLLDAICLTVCAIMLSINIGVFVEDHTVQAIYYPYNLSLWLSLSLLFSSVFTTALVIRSDLNVRPRFCGMLLFALAVCCALLGGFSFLRSPSFGLDYPMWYLGQLLLYVLAVVAVISLNRIEHAVVRPFFIVLACIISAAAVVICVAAGTMNDVFPVDIYPRVLSVLLLLPLPVFSVFVWGIIWTKRK